MVPVSVHDVHRYIPRALRDQAGAPVFLLRTPSLRQRAAWRRDIAAAGARFVATSELLEQLRAAIGAWGLSNSAELIELVDQAEAMSEGKAPIDAEVAQRMRALENIMQGFGPYAELVAARSFWWEISTMLAFRHFVCGWENLAPAYAARLGLVDEAVVDQLPDAFVFEVGTEAVALTSPDASQRKNFESPRPSPSDPAISLPTSGLETAGAGA